MKTEIKHQILDLEDLQTFKKAGVLLGPELGEKLETTPSQVICCVRQDEFDAATIYRQIIGRKDENFTTVICDDPIVKACGIAAEHTIPIVVTSAINPNLKDIMFQNP